MTLPPKMLLLFAAKTELIFDNYGSLVTKITDIDAIEEPTIMPDIVSMRFAREMEPKEKQDAEMENILQLIADLLEEDANYDTLHLLLGQDFNETHPGCLGWYLWDYLLTNQLRIWHFLQDIWQIGHGSRYVQVSEWCTTRNFTMKNAGKYGEFSASSMAMENHEQVT